MKKPVDVSALSRVIVTDCGSTTTKALLFEKKGSVWRQTFRGESPTTVERPIADVTVGVHNSFLEVEELCGKSLLNPDTAGTIRDECPLIIRDSETQDEGVDLYLSTSSAGGGLQMVVTGVVGAISAESAERAALGAGAIVMDRLSTDVIGEDYEAIQRLRHLKPDMMLVAGGYEGGARAQVIDIVELIKAAAPRPRFGSLNALPLIYAGNSALVEEIEHIWGAGNPVTVVENVRPTVTEERLNGARDAIHELFLTHVMSQSPGYSKLLEWSPYPVMPTPAAVGDMVQAFARESGKQVLCVDIGGATTDVFSTVRNNEGDFVFNRTVSANLGMSYSVGNVLLEAGVENILRWLPYAASKDDVCDILRNKMIRPTSIPSTLEELWLEQAVCREALRLSLVQHRAFAVSISTSGGAGGISSVFKQRARRHHLVNPMELDVVIGSGGVLSHAPSRLSAALMMIEGFSLSGITELCVDSIFMMPHLGVFSSIHRDAAIQIFNSDCIVPVAVSVVPVYLERAKGRELAEIYVEGNLIGTVSRGVVQHLPVYQNETVEIEVKPKSGVDVGGGSGMSVRRRVNAGMAGFILDGRGAPVLSQYITARNNMEVYRGLGLDKV
jgi:uncharacterized protein (TIGR01319 family)